MTDGPWRFVHEPLLGTVVVVDIHGPDEATANGVDREIVAEIRRLQAIFDSFDPTSELSRWKRGELARPSSELATVLAVARDHQVASGGRFNPAVGVLVELWRQAERTGLEPDAETLRAAAARIAEPPYRIVGDDLVVDGDLSGIDLNALAKGWIVDKAVELVAGTYPDLASIVVNAGGDLRHVGSVPLVVGVENPLRPFDNEPPLDVVQVRNVGLATSGRSRRGHRVGDRWHSHVLDPRNGRPVDGLASITVIAADVATADLTATVLGVISPVDAIAEAESLDIACCVVDASGTLHRTSAWRRRRPADADGG